MSLLTRPRVAVPVPTRRPLRLAVRGTLLVLAALLGYEVFRVVGWTNRHAVVPGKVYRCAQPSDADLRELVRDRGIRTVINLRGLSPQYDWYAAEARANHDLNVSQEDVTLSANRLPPPAELRRVVEVLDGTEYPVLIHCKAGADRTGLVSTMYLLLHTDSSLAEARRQLWPRYGHVRFGRTAAMDDFFDRYEGWLTTDGVPHSRERFRKWVTEVYTAGPAKSELTWLDPVPNPVPADKPFSVRLRAVNRSNEAWEFRPGDNAGIHLGYVVANESLLTAYRGKAGLMHKTVQPGEAIELTVTVPPLKVPGNFALAAELHDARGAGISGRAMSFVQLGDDPILASVVVR